MLFASYVQIFVMPVQKNVINTIRIIVKDVRRFVVHARKSVQSWLRHNQLIFVWLISIMRLPLRSTSRSRAVVARWAHNPKVGSSNLPFATKKSQTPVWLFNFSGQLQFNWQGIDHLLHFL
jgi:hypothetical protein